MTIKKAFRLMNVFIIVFISISFLIVLLFRFIPFAYTPLMAIRSVEQAWNPKTDIHFKKQWVAIENISPHLISAVIASEDQLFLSHNGFDMASIKKAFVSNQKHAKRAIKGASTISQQTAKNAFLWPARSWVRKGFEAWFTLLIELCWSKERIMEVYLNIIEMGDGVYGAQAAAQHYFKKDAKHLSANEAASIAAILPNPLRWSAAKPSNYIRQRTYWIQRQMRNIGAINLTTE